MSSAPAAVVYVGDGSQGATSRMRAAALDRLGVTTLLVNTSELDKSHAEKSLVEKAVHRYFPLRTRASRRTTLKVLEAVKSCRPKLLWVDKGLLVSPVLLQEAEREYGVVAVHYNPDDPFGSFRNGWSGFLKALPHYRVHFVPREENIPEYCARGARAVYQFDRGFDPQVHRPVSLDGGDIKRYGASIGMVGTFAHARASSIAHLVSKGMSVSIRGADWDRSPDWQILKPHFRGGPVLADEYAKAICGLDIALHFVRHENRDQQDSRTFEIPACGVFMLAERTPKHMELFEDGKEAVFFSSNDELEEKARYYLDHPLERKRIAQAGYERCYRSGYSYESRLRGLLDRVYEATGVKVP